MLRFLIVLFSFIIIQTDALQHRQIGPAIESPAGLLAFSQAYNITLNPVPNDAPVIKIGYLLTLSGDDMVAINNDAGTPGIVQMMVDLTNAQGGVWMQGMQHAISAIIVDDQSSSILSRILVEQLVTQQSVYVVVPPVAESLIKPLAQQSVDLDVSFVTSLAYGSCTLDGGTDNLYSLQVTSDNIYDQTLRTVNNQAKSFYPPDTSKYPFTATGYVSSFGFTSVCIYTMSRDSSCDDIAPGIVSWITAENANRSAAGGASKDLITYTRIRIPPTVSTYNEYVKYWLMCPDKTDVVISPMTIVGGRSLSLSKRRFKAIIGTNYIPGRQALTVGDLAEISAGWLYVIPISDPSSVSLSLSRPFASANGLGPMYARYASASELPSGVSLILRARTAEFAVIVAALNASDGLSRQPFREAILSLNSQTTIQGSLNLNSTTGENQVDERYYSSLVQYLNSGMIAGLNDRGDVIRNYQPIYPFDFYFLPIFEEGDHLPTYQGSSFIIGSVLITVFAAWIGQIIFDSLLMLRERGSKYMRWVWLLLSAEALSGGISCVHFGMSLGMKVKGLSSGDKFEDFDWFVWMCWVQWHSALVLTMLALHILSDPMRSSKVRCSMVLDSKRSNRLHSIVSRSSDSTAIDRRATLVRREQAKKRSRSQEFVYLLRMSLQWRCLLAGVMLSSAVIASHIATFNAYHINAMIRPGAAASVFGSVLLIVTMPFVAASFRHGLRWRVPTVFIFGAVIMLHWQFHYLDQTIVYDPSPDWMSHETGLFDMIVSHHRFAVLIALLAVGGCVTFVFFQFAIMRISHSDMLAASSKMQTLVNKAHARMQKAERIHSEQKDLISSQAACLKARNQEVRSLENTCDEQVLRLKIMRETLSGMFLISNFTVEFALPLSIFEEAKLDVALPVGDRDSASMQLAATAAETERVNDTSPNQSAASYVNTNAIRSPFSVNRSIVRGVSGESPLTHPSTLDSRPHVIPDKTYELSLRQVLSHVCCTIMFKHFMFAFGTTGWSNVLACYFLMRRYRVIRHGTLRQLVAAHIIRVFLSDTAHLSVHISPVIRSTILLRASNEQVECPSDLFASAENELLLLMESTSFKRFSVTSGYQLCCWFYTALPLNGDISGRGGSMSDC